MKVSVLDERGYDIALFGLGMSRGITSELSFEYFEAVDPHTEQSTAEYLQIEEVAQRLASNDNGENKFLESIGVWLDIDAPRYWWQQFDTYRVGVSKQSESTMYSLTKRKLEQSDFNCHISPLILSCLNSNIELEEFEILKANLPESFLQRRIVATNYKTLRHVYQQRRDHRLAEWQLFCDTLEQELLHPGFLR